MKDENKISVWAKRFGVAGLVFFTVKGLLWLLVPTLFIWWGASMGS